MALNRIGHSTTARPLPRLKQPSTTRLPFEVIDPKLPLFIPAQVSKQVSECSSTFNLFRCDACHWSCRSCDRKYSSHMLGPHLAKDRCVTG